MNLKKAAGIFATLSLTMAGLNAQTALDPDKEVQARELLRRFTQELEGTEAPRTSKPVPPPSESNEVKKPAKPAKKTIADAPAAEPVERKRSWRERWFGGRSEKEAYESTQEEKRAKARAKAEKDYDELWDVKPRKDKPSKEGDEVFAPKKKPVAQEEPPAKKETVAKKEAPEKSTAPKAATRSLSIDPPLVDAAPVTNASVKPVAATGEVAGKTQKEKLDALLTLYRGNLISPKEYHEQRAKILSAP